VVDAIGFPRFEWKFVVPFYLRGPLVRDLQVLMVPDANAGADGAYGVQSLYLDSMDRVCFSDKADGVPRRQKLRIRTYDVAGVPASKVKFEIKYRDGERIRKDTALVNGRDYRHVWLPRLRAFAGLAAAFEASAVLGTFFRLSRLGGLRPCTVVRFRRWAFRPKGREQYRVTIDDTLTGWRSDDVLAAHAGGGPPASRGDFLLELKTPGRIPYSMEQILRKYRLRRTAFSKYAYVVAQGSTDFESGS
jgi:hypothetical protein